MCMKTCMYPLFKQEAAKKPASYRYVCTYCCVRVNAVRYIVFKNFCGDQIFLDFIRFLIHEVFHSVYSIIFAMPGIYQLVYH